jgi:hypothetical protein
LRAYSTVVAAAALRVDRRWLDVLVAQHRIEGVQREGQGVSRAISPAAVLTIAVALELMEVLQTPIARGLELARALLASGGEHWPADAMLLKLDLGAIERRMASRLTEAVEAHPPPKRGRPPREP